MQIGKQLLNHPRLMDRVAVTCHLCLLLAEHIHLADKAALLLARILTMFRVRRGTRESKKG